MGIERIEWRPASGGSVPEDAVHAGIDSGNKMYVARAQVDGGVIPGKLQKTHTSAYISFNAKEIPVDYYEVLCGPPASLSWIEGSGGSIPHNAVVGGKDPSGEALYIGRVIHDKTVTVGKVHPSHGRCYFPYGGKEHSNTEYEILVKNKFGQFLNV